MIYGKQRSKRERRYPLTFLSSFRRTLVELLPTVSIFFRTSDFSFLSPVRFFVAAKRPSLWPLTFLSFNRSASSLTPQAVLLVRAFTFFLVFTLTLRSFANIILSRFFVDLYNFSVVRLIPSPAAPSTPGSILFVLGSR